jgi:hypothetical protein
VKGAEIFNKVKGLGWALPLSVCILNGGLRLWGSMAVFEKSLTIITLEGEGTETAQYAADFIEVFEKAGWKPHIELQRGMDANVWMLAKADDPVAAFLLRQLRQPDVGIEVLMEPIRYASWPEKTIKLGVGPQQVR